MFLDGKLFCDIILQTILTKCKETVLSTYLSLIGVPSPSLSVKIGIQKKLNLITKIWKLPFCCLATIKFQLNEAIEQLFQL